MESLIARKGAMVAAVLLLLSACAGSASGVPSPAQAAQAATSRAANDAKSTNLSGEWSGKQTDIAYGTGKAKASYTQYNNGLGGVLTVKFANSSATSSVALSVSGSTVNGTTVALSGSFYCTFSTTSTYDPSTHTMSGSYQAVYGCTGDSGTFTLKHKCFYKGTGSDAIRPDNGPRPC
jgi:hypothetical protein